MKDWILDHLPHIWVSTMIIFSLWLAANHAGML